MTGLVLNIRPYEKVLINGAIIQNGRRRAQLRIETQDTNFLRLSDALDPDTPKTPLRRIYLAAQALVIDDQDHQQHEHLISLISEAQEGYDGICFESALQACGVMAKERRYFPIMKMLKPLLPKEAALLNLLNVEPGR